MEILQASSSLPAFPLLPRNTCLISHLFLSYSQRNQKTCFCWEALVLQALISITTAFEVSQTDAYCKKQGYVSAFTYLSWGVLTVGSQREEWERKQSWCQGQGFVLGCPRLSPTPWHWTQWDVKLCVTLEKPWTFCTEHSVQRLSLVQGTQWRVHAPITLQAPWWTVHETAGNMGIVGNGLHKKSIAPGWWQLFWVLDF